MSKNCMRAMRTRLCGYATIGIPAFIVRVAFAIRNRFMIGAAIAILPCMAIYALEDRSAGNSATNGIRGTAAMTGPTVMRSYPRLNYYTGEKEAQIVCEIGLPARERADLVLVARDAAGMQIGRTESVQPLSLLSVPLGPSTGGVKKVVVELARRNRENLARQEVDIVRLPPNPGCEWKIDRYAHCILTEGKPFFPFGVINNRPMADMPAALKDLAGAGFNTLLRLWRGPFDRAGDLADLCGEQGLALIEVPHMFIKSTLLPGEHPKPGLSVIEVEEHWINVVGPAAIERLKTKANIPAWYLFDEPGVKPEWGEMLGRYNRKAHTADPYRPTYIGFFPPNALSAVPTGSEWSDSCDILGIDPYWMPGDAGSYRAPDRVGSCTEQTRRIADHRLQLTWVIPCAELYSGTRLRVLDRREQFVQTYMALIHGANGLIYFVYPFRLQSTYDTFVALGHEMKVLGPACVQPEIRQTFRYSAGDHTTADVQVALKRHPQAGCILLAANWRPYPVDVRYKLPLLEKCRTVRLLFDEKRQYPIDQGALVDSLEPMSTRAYWIDGAADALVEPVEIGVNLAPHPDRTEPFYAARAEPDSGPPGQANILRNPGFEQCSIPGMPDYYWDFRTLNTHGSACYRIGDARGDPYWGIVTNTPYEGKNCLRLKGNQSALLFGTSPRLDRPAIFTLSVYARADREGAILRFYGPYDHSRPDRHVLSTRWQKFSESVTLTPDLPYGGHRLGFVSDGSSSADATIWLDAMQLEKGSEPTEYKE